MITPGNTFLLPSGKDKNHLFFVAIGDIFLPEMGNSPHLALVNATTLYEGAPHDPACILEVGEHPFIQHRSYIAYRYTRLDPRPHIERLAWNRHQDCSPELLARIVAGIFQSRLTPRHIKQALAVVHAG
jgi:hypothetical protein